jgi:hypothetical protein
VPGNVSVEERPGKVDKRNGSKTCGLPKLPRFTKSGVFRQEQGNAK